MLFKEIVDGRTHGRTDDGQRTPDIEGSQKLTEHFVLRWAKKVTNHVLLDSDTSFWHYRKHSNYRQIIDNIW